MLTPGLNADTVNRWVAERTRGLIPTIVDAGVVQDQELVLVNTVYLKANWVEPFQPDLTSDGQFNTGDNRSVTVPFMRDRKPVHRRYVQLEHADAVELPYQDGELAMWLIVPHDPAGLTSLEESLDAATLTGLHSTARTGPVDLTMPKWEQTLKQAADPHPTASSVTSAPARHHHHSRAHSRQPTPRLNLKAPPNRGTLPVRAL